MPSLWTPGAQMSACHGGSPCVGHFQAILPSSRPLAAAFDNRRRPLPPVGLGQNSAGSTIIKDRLQKPELRGWLRLVDLQSLRTKPFLRRQGKLRPTTPNHPQPPPTTPNHPQPPLDPVHLFPAKHPPTTNSGDFTF